MTRILRTNRPRNDDVVLDALDRKMAGFRNGVGTAKEWGMSRSELCRVKSGNLPMSQKVAAKLGYELLWVKRGAN